MPRIGNYEFPDELEYMTISLWYSELENNRYRLGITDIAQKRLGDIVAIEMPEPSSNIHKGNLILSIESIQREETYKAPIGIHVIKINNDVSLEPELLNQNPYENWILEFRLLEEDDLDILPDIEDILDEAITIVEKESGSSRKRGDEEFDFEDDDFFSDNGYDDDYREEDSYSSIFY